MYLKARARLFPSAVATDRLFSLISATLCPPHQKKNNQNIKCSFKTTEISAESARNVGKLPKPSISLCFDDWHPEAGRERATALLHHSPSGAYPQSHSHHPNWGRQFQGTVSLHQEHPVAKASFQEEKGQRQASPPQVLVAKTPLDLLSPSLPHFGKFYSPYSPCLLSFPSSQYPPPLKSFILA